MHTTENMSKTEKPGEKSIEFKDKKRSFFQKICWMCSDWSFKKTSEIYCFFASFLFRLKKSISIDFFSLLEPLGTQASLISFVVQENKVLCIKRKVPLSGHFGSRSDSGTMIQFLIWVLLTPFSDVSRSCGSDAGAIAQRLEGVSAAVQVECIDWSDACHRNMIDTLIQWTAQTPDSTPGLHTLNTQHSTLYNPHSTLHTPHLSLKTPHSWECFFPTQCVHTEGFLR